LVRHPTGSFHLTEAEIEKLIAAAKKGRWGHRDATMILVAYRHGLRVSELVDLRWDQIDFNTGNMAISRVKSGVPSTHPMRGDELRALRRLQREQKPKSPFVFTSERGNDRWETHLASRGVVIEGRNDWERGGRSIYFRDPDGHLLELATPGLWSVY
jgi:integrase